MAGSRFSLAKWVSGGVAFETAQRVKVECIEPVKQPSSLSRPDRRVPELDGIRAVAILLVVIWHYVHLVTESAPGTLWGRVNILLRLTWSGVDLFFVLSGFIIAMSSRRLAEQGRGWRDYFQARWVRIYVPYLPVGLGMYVLYLLLPGLSQGGRTPGLWTTLTLLPGTAPPGSTTEP